MVKKLIFFLIPVILLLPIKVFAYSVVDTTQTNFSPDYPILNRTAVDNPTILTTSGPTNMGTSPWLYSLANYWYGTGNGNWLNVSVDQYVLYQVNPGMGMTDYLGNATRNTLTLDNLRCAVDGLQSNYDSTYIPQITNFKVILEKFTTTNTGFFSYRYHLTFNYVQQLSRTYNGSYNMSCWFERNPSNGLFLQITGGNTNGNVYSYYYDNRFQYSVTTSADTRLLNDISNGINNVNNSINNITNDINDDSLPNVSNFLDDWTDLLLENNTINQILYLPINLLTNIRNAFTGTCTNYVLPFGLTGGNETLTFKCWTIGDYLGNEVTALISGLIGFFMIYHFALFLWKFYDDFTSMKDTLSAIYGYDDPPLGKGEIE